MSWSILRKKRYDTLNLDEKEQITLEEWQANVENDSELIWAENSPIADAYKKIGREWISSEGQRQRAYFEINKRGYGNLRFKYIKYYITIDCERQTLKRVEKMWEVAQALKGYLFKKGTRFTEKKLEKLREKYK